VTVNLAGVTVLDPSNPKGIRQRLAKAKMKMLDMFRGRIKIPLTLPCFGPTMKKNSETEEEKAKPKTPIKKNAPREREASQNHHN
jgi:hypothetical protein